MQGERKRDKSQLAAGEVLTGYTEVFFFRMRLVKCWNKCPEKPAKSPSLGIFRIWLDLAPNNQSLWLCITTLEISKQTHILPSLSLLQFMELTFPSHTKFGKPVQTWQRSLCSRYPWEDHFHGTFIAMTLSSPGKGR